MRAGRAMDPAIGDMAPAALLGALLDAPDAEARVRESEALAHVGRCLWGLREI